MHPLIEGFRAVLPLFVENPKRLPDMVCLAYRLVNGDMAQHIPAVRFEDGILELAADANWKKEGRKREASVIKAINAMFKADIVTSVKWVPWEDRPEKELMPVEQPAELAVDEDDYPMIQDEEMRKAFSRFTRAIKARENS